jgi:hypothetical protein
VIIATAAREAVTVLHDETVIVQGTLALEPRLECGVDERRSHQGGDPGTGKAEVPSPQQADEADEGRDADDEQQGQIDSACWLIHCGSIPFTPRLVAGSAMLPRRASAARERGSIR